MRGRNDGRERRREGKRGNQVRTGLIPLADPEPSCRPTGGSSSGPETRTRSQGAGAKTAITHSIVYYCYYFINLFSFSGNRITGNRKKKNRKQNRKNGYFLIVLDKNK